MEFQLKDGMLLGAASAATQIEGGDDNSNWYDWYRRGYVKDDSDPSCAVDHYERWREDLELMKDMGIQCYRMGVEWSRVEPQDGVFDEKAIAHYREEIQALKEAGIPVLLTLHHFNNPLWLEERGGFAQRDNITCYLRFVRKMVESVGDLVSEYITINEPNVYAYNGYLEGAWPPGRKSFLEMSRVMTNMAAAHIEAYGLIRKTRLQMGYKDTRVGVANHLRAFAPKDPKNPLQRFWAERVEELFRNDDLKVLVATSAFGEGVDIPNIRHVVLYHLPFSDVEFNQMSGRAGRDGKPAWVHLLYGRGDAALNERILAEATPDHDVMAQVYRRLRHLQRECPNDYFCAGPADLAHGASDGFHRVSPVSAACGLAVFRELGLIETRTVREAGREALWVRVQERADRVELTDSVRYREGIDERTLFGGFCRWALGTDEPALTVRLCHPIVPRNRPGQGH